MAKRTCSVEGCERPHKGHGYCKLHLRRLKEHGDPLYVRDRRCSEEGCERKHEARGLCDMHYQRLKHHGSTDDPRRPRLALFWAKVDKNGPIPEFRPDLGPCWLWLGSKDFRGYGQFWDGQRVVPSHRWSYGHFVEPIADDLHTDHLCRNPSCCRPSHLEPVTPMENVHRGLSGVLHVPVTRCPQGHPYAGDNLYVNPNTGRRACKACRTVSLAAFKERRRAAARLTS